MHVSSQTKRGSKPEYWEVREQIAEVQQDLQQVPDQCAWNHLLQLADLENELHLESFLSGLKLALGISAEPAPFCSFDGKEEPRNEPRMMAVMAMSEQEKTAAGRNGTLPDRFQDR